LKIEQWIFIRDRRKKERRYKLARAGWEEPSWKDERKQKIR
jgi:hypothetical protein